MKRTNELQKALFRLEFALHPLSRQAHDLMMRIGRGEVTDLFDLADSDDAALNELVRRGLINLMSASREERSDEGKSNVEQIPKRP